MVEEVITALTGLGLAWAEVWVMRVDRRAGTLVVVATSGKKYSAVLESPPAAGGKKLAGGPENQKTAAGRGRPGRQETNGH